jgi:hypothetical protein
MDGLAVAIDALALLAAGVVFARPAAARWRRGLLAFGSLTCAATSPVLIPAGTAPQWIRIVAVCALFVAFCAIAAVVSPIGGAPDDDESGGVTGDWDPHCPEGPGGGTDDFQPDWWPEFERDFANYVAQPLPPLRREAGGVSSKLALA